MAPSAHDSSSVFRESGRSARLLPEVRLRYARSRRRPWRGAEAVHIVFRQLTARGPNVSIATKDDTQMHSETDVIIRTYDPIADLASLRGCIIEQQEFHRGLEPSWPEGTTIIDDYVKYLERQCARYDGRVIVAVSAGELIGFVCVVASTNNDSPDDPAPFAWVHEIFVKPAYRRQHIATRLMSEAESFARAHGAHVLRLGVLAQNAGARMFYREHGFRDYVSVLSKSLD